MTKRFLTWGLALLCLSAMGLGAQPKGEKTTIVLDWTVNTNHTGLYVALANGYFRDEGLDVSVIAAPDIGAAALLAAGKADFAYSFQEEILQSRAQGLNLTAVAAVLQNNTSSFMARKSSGIARPRDFEGRRYGGGGSPMEEAIIRALMKADGGDPSKVVTRNVGEADFFAATERTVDFEWVFDGWEAIDAQVRGVPVNLISLRKISPVLNWYTPVLAANQTLIQKNPQRVRAFLKAISKGYEFAVAHPEESAAILLKAAPELNPALVKASQKFLAGEYRAQASRWGEFDPARWKGFYEWMRQNKLVPELPQGGAFFTNEFLPQK